MVIGETPDSRRPYTNHARAFRRDGLRGVVRGDEGNVTYHL